VADTHRLPGADAGPLSVGGRTPGVTAAAAFGWPMRVPAPFPHFGDEDSGYGIVLLDPATGIGVGLHHHRDNTGEPADERRCGLDHMAFQVPARADLDAWASWLDALGLAHSGANDAADPVPYSALVFRDPDNVQLEIFHMDPSG
jgi:glyoxylase I family protein